MSIMDHYTSHLTEAKDAEQLFLNDLIDGALANLRNFSTKIENKKIPLTAQSQLKAQKTVLKATLTARQSIANIQSQLNKIFKG